MYRRKGWKKTPTILRRRSMSGRIFRFARDELTLRRRGEEIVKGGKKGHVMPPATGKCAEGFTTVVPTDRLPTKLGSIRRCNLLSHNKSTSSYYILCTSTGQSEFRRETSVVRSTCSKARNRRIRKSVPIKSVPTREGTTTEKIPDS